MHHPTATLNPESLRLDDTLWKRGRAVILAIGAIAWAASLAGYAADSERFAFSYLVAFVFFVSAALGAMFFVMVQHITGSTWSVTMRRLMENVMSTITPAAVLFIPVAFGLHELYLWTHADAVAKDALLQGKQAYLNEPFFYLRTAIYFGVWTLFARKLIGHSEAQDTTKDVKHTWSARRWSAPGLLVVFLTTTFASFDWLMSLDPHWYSTIFGIYFYSGAGLAFIAAMILIALGLRRAGVLGDAIHAEHYHDLGKWLFALTLFWSYIAFSQYMLIWYANIPEETIWFRHRMEEGWLPLTQLLVFGHFLFHFLLLLPRAAKRNTAWLAGMATWMLAMHYVDLYWIVMPTLDPHGAHFHWLDLTTLAAVGSVFAYAFWSRLRGRYLAPVGDPRFERSLGFENV